MKATYVCCDNTDSVLWSSATLEYHIADYITYDTVALSDQ